jgi:hypothetical protein
LYDHKHYLIITTTFTISLLISTQGLSAQTRGFIFFFFMSDSTQEHSVKVQPAEVVETPHVALNMATSVSVDMGTGL